MNRRKSRDQKEIRTARSGLTSPAFPRTSTTYFPSIFRRKRSWNFAVLSIPFSSNDLVIVRGIFLPCESLSIFALRLKTNLTTFSGTLKSKVDSPSL